MSKDNENESVISSVPAIEVAKQRQEGKIFTLPTGERARIACVTGAMVNEITSRIPYPPVPQLTYEDKPDKSFPNPDDPKYKEACAEVDRQRGLASMDAYIMFGVDLLDSIPEGDKWLVKLKWMDKKGYIDIDWDEFDLSDPMDREFVYKKYVAVPNDIVMEVLNLSGLSPDRIEDIEDSFPDSEVRDSS